MNLSILSIGDEIVFGEIADTNAAFLSRRLYDMGIRTVRHLAVGDREEDIVAAMRELAEGNDVVIATGGLGPTEDDRTTTAAAMAAGVPLAMNDEARRHLGKVTCKLGGDLSRNEKQALLPEGSAVIPNPTGTACGFQLTCGECDFFFLPGVPSEMMRMAGDSLLPAVARRLAESRTLLTTKVLKVAGIAEADLGSLLEGVDREQGISIAYAVSFPEIHIKLRAEGEDGRSVAERLEAAAKEARHRLRDHLFAEDDGTIDSVVAHLFRRTGATLSLAESCTGGLVAQRMTDIPGSSAYFLEGAVTYSDEAKMRTLGVPRELLVAHGAVSSETAVAMAVGMRERTGSDLSLAITGIAGPEGGSAEKPVGTVHIALASRDGCRAWRYIFSGDRREIRLITSFKALDLLRRFLQSPTQ